MPEELSNVALAREGIQAFNRGDIDWLLQRIDEDFVFDWSRSRSPLRGVYRGQAGVGDFIREQWSSFEEFTIEPREFIDRGPNVVVPITLRARGREGIEVSADNVHVYRIEQGRVARVTMYQEVDEALAATSGDESRRGDSNP
jgi:ketosteroid isomerase-like protein